MITSNELTKLLPALLSAQKELKPVLKQDKNPHIGNRYAGLPDIMEEAFRVLHKNSLLLVQSAISNLEPENQSVSVETRIYHISGEFISSEISTPVTPMKKRDGSVVPVDSQMIGSAITYLRRYGLQTLIGIVADVDDDGNGACGDKFKAPDMRPDYSRAVKGDIPEPPKVEPITPQEFNQLAWITLGKLAETEEEVQSVSNMISSTPALIPSLRKIAPLGELLLDGKVGKETIQQIKNDLGFKSIFSLKGDSLKKAVGMARALKNE